MRGLLGYLKGFKGDGIADRERANPNIGVAFLLVALIVAFVGFRWMSESRDDSLDGSGWTLGGESASGDGSTTIPASPAAVAVRIGTDQQDGSDDTERPETSGSVLPDGTPIAPLPRTATTSPTRPGGSTTTTGPTTVIGPPDTTTSTTLPETTTTSDTEPPTSIGP